MRNDVPATNGANFFSDERLRREFLRARRRPGRRREVVPAHVVRACLPARCRSQGIPFGIDLGSRSRLRRLTGQVGNARGRRLRDAEQHRDSACLHERAGVSEQPFRFLPEFPQILEGEPALGDGLDLAASSAPW